MVAYSFKPRFVSCIEAGTKHQTIRAERKGRARHARPGGPVTLLTGPRMKPVLIGRSVCTGVFRIILDFKNGGVRTIAPVSGVSTATTDVAGLDAFARGDGFDDWHDMQMFWMENHGSIQFEGVMIKWRHPFNG